MPELPEVETVRRGLGVLLGSGAVVDRVRIRRRDLRRPIPRGFAGRLAARPILAIERRAKYLLWRFPDGWMINHLGMTGTWRVANGRPADRHDHLLIDLVDGRRLAFRDPRRFGLVDFVPGDDPHRDPGLARLGIEPLDPAFDGPFLGRAFAGRRVAIKTALMDQRVVVGIGNIYANEALFRARIRPQAVAGSLGPRRCARVATACRAVLEEAIEAGGSTIDDFRHAGGGRGYFQHAFRVYGRAGEVCPECGRRLRGGVVGGRATVWCGGCQRG